MPVRSVSIRWRVALLAGLVVAGLAVSFLELFDWRVALDLARGYAARWWLPPALVALQAALFMFALPGSTVLWIVAPLYAPVTATVIQTAGGVAGALAAYGFAQSLTGKALANLRARRGFQVLERESDFLLLCALRLLPAFPHSLLNYGAGILRLPLAPFLVSVAIGFGVKAYLYSSVIHNALAAAKPADLLRPEALLPLVLLALAFAAARLLRRRFQRSPPPVRRAPPNEKS